MKKKAFNRMFNNYLTTLIRLHNIIYIHPIFITKGGALKSDWMDYNNLIPLLLTHSSVRTSYPARQLTKTLGGSFEIRPAFSFETVNNDFSGVLDNMNVLVTDW